jgi:rhodanese-related sulfurtransferase
MGQKSTPPIAQFREAGILVTGIVLVLLLIGMASIKNATVLWAPKNDSVTWDAVFGWIQHDWPEVPQMSTDELARRMAAGNGAGPFLIDVRTREEYKVSHLPGAVWAGTPSEIAAALRTVPGPVVLYCSVGVRSSKAAANLMRSGRANVFSLQGSIFKWANEGRPLIADDHAVHVVHPYNKRWGVLLKPELRSYSPLHFSQIGVIKGVPGQGRFVPASAR